LSTTGELFSPHSKRQKVELTPEEEQAWAEKAVRLKMNMMAHIKNGKGFIGIHSATDTFYDWPEYGDMIGAYFDGHPWTAKTEVTIKVAEGQENNPLVSYLGDDNLIFQEEIYQYRERNIKGNANVLLQLDPIANDFSKSNSPEDKFIPISWTKQHGEGRVFYSSLGHNQAIFHNTKVLQHYLNGIQWVLE